MDESKKQPSRRHVRLSRAQIWGLVILMAMTTLTVLSLVWFVLRLLPIQHVELRGSTRYEVTDLRRAMELGQEEKLFHVDTEEMEQILLKRCPYLKTVSIERSLPDRLVISVTERVPVWYLKIGSLCYVLDEELLVVEESTNENLLLESGLVGLKLPNLKSAVVGEFPVFGMVSNRSEEENHREIKMTCELLAQIQVYRLRLTLLDLESRFDIQAVSEGRFRIYFGDYTQMDSKLEFVKRLLDENRELYQTGEIDASDISSNIHFRPTAGESETAG
ncbi:MAG: FtsQ-type POTRA domain-containing protein [Clostridia bacterium]|nr:FtsQ-type POTRA domain-containing protein [Clostridia bacterium]